MEAKLAPVQQQLEFYFGDANLLKDKWLKQTIDANAEGCARLLSPRACLGSRLVRSLPARTSCMLPYADVETKQIAAFNKMKQLCDSDCDQIIRAARRSELLQVCTALFAQRSTVKGCLFRKVSKDGKWLRRVAPLPETDDADERTVFVEVCNTHARKYDTRHVTCSTSSKRCRWRFVLVVAAGERAEHARWPAREVFAIW